MNLYATEEETEGAGIPRLELGEWIESAFSWVQTNLSVVFDTIQAAISWFSGLLVSILTAPDALVLAVIFSVIAWLLRTWKFALLSLAMWLFVISVEQWQNAMYTLVLVFIATVIALLLAVPIGIAAAKSNRVSNVVRPVMDLMQTMPAFVWLVPVIMLFSVGITPGVIATIIFALPPGVRLTELGIRQVDAEVVEAGHAFGNTGWQILRKIQLPLAMPTIMTGVNQVIMLALSMAVIGGMVGAPGLGLEVTRAISTIDMGLGFESGLSVVVLAIFLDRITAGVGRGREGDAQNTLQRLLRGRRRPFTKDTAGVGGDPATAGDVGPVKQVPVP